MLSVTLLGSGPLGPAQALAPQALREPPQPQPPCSRPPATPPGPISPKRAPAPHRWTEIPPLFYRTLFPSGLLPCLNLSIEKRWPRAINSQQYPLPCCAHFRLPKCVMQGRGLLALGRLFRCVLASL